MHLAVLERLSDSSFPAFRSAAMLAIRRIADPKTVPFLIEKLRVTDKIVAYEAVMALSEITGKHEMATDMASFEQSPEPHVARWEKWYAESSAKLK